MGFALTPVSFSSCRRLWGSVALARHSAMGPRLCGISVAISRLQGLCCKSGSSAVPNPYVSRLWDLVLVLGQSRMKAGIPSLQENQLRFMEPEMFWVKHCMVFLVKQGFERLLMCLNWFCYSHLHSRNPGIWCCAANAEQRDSSLP